MRVAQPEDQGQDPNHKSARLTLRCTRLEFVGVGGAATPPAIVRLPLPPLRRAEPDMATAAADDSASVLKCEDDRGGGATAPGA